MKDLITLAGLLMSMLLSFPLAAAELEKQTIVFGYMEDSSPVSGHDNVTNGFCGAVFNFLQNHYEVKSRQLRVDQRFDIFANLKIADANSDAVRVQCGPDSKTRGREKILKTVNGVFSHTFAKTSIKLLIRNNALDNAVNNIESLRIGVVAKTNQLNKTEPDSNSANDVLPKQSDPVNTESTIKNVFPNSTIKLLTNREDAIIQLRNNAIDAYASDAIILNHILTVNLKEEKDSYSLYPVAEGYSHEEYALSVYNDQPDGDQGSVISALNEWLGNAPEAIAAEKKLQPPHDWIISVLQWLNRDDHLGAARLIFYVSLGAMVIMLGLMASWRFFPLLRSAKNIESSYQAGPQNAHSDALENAASERSNSQKADSLQDVNSTEMEELAIKKLSTQLLLWLKNVELTDMEKKVFRQWNPVLEVEIAPVKGEPVTKLKLGEERKRGVERDKEIITIRTHITNIKKKFRAVDPTTVLKTWLRVSVHTDPKNSIPAVLHSWLEKHDSKIQNDCDSHSLNVPDPATMNDNELET